MSDTSPPSFTKSLLSSPEVAGLYERATQNEFLALAGQGRLPRHELAMWLSQDRLYCQAYARFIGGLISRVQLPQEPGTGAGTSISDSLEWRILKVLRDALVGMMVELRFFEDTARDYGIDLQTVGCKMESQALGFGPNKVTREYIELFDSFTAGKTTTTTAAAAATDGSASPRPDKSLFEGLLVLWATEQAYFEAWSYAKRQQYPADRDPAQDLDGGALRTRLIDNWTSDAFRVFVVELTACLEDLAAAQRDDTREVLLANSLTVVRKVLVLEEGFWPVVA